ncbi:MAG: ATPase [Chloroflexi bacterium RBG_13_46_14]|nr:MAG: ATPase [Chloroflexi bacterium RBG_13_46_14]
MLFDPSALATIGAALALIGGLVGSSIGIGIAGSAGAATLSEDPSQFRNVIIFASLPMTQTFYGLIVLILITTVISKMDTVVANVGEGAGAMILSIGLMAGAAECFSAIYQGHVCASCISLLPKTKGKILTNGIMLAVFVELLGVLGFVFAIMAMSMLGLM